MKRFTRLLAGVLALCMLLCLLPTALAHTGTSPDDVFEAINTAIETLQAKKSTPTDTQKTDAARAAVQALGYAVDDNGNEQFTWYVGSTACVYSSRLRELTAQSKPVDGLSDDGNIVSIDYGKRGSCPGAVDVALFEPYFGLDSSFNDTYQNQCKRIAATTGGTYTLYKTAAATIDSIADALQTSAVVVFDSHGITDYENGDDNTSQANTSYLCLQSGEGLTDADQAPVSGEFGTYQHALYGGSSGEGDDKMYYYCVDGTAIANHMTADAPSNLVWNAICLGMATDGLCAPLREKGVGVLYGYSQSVYFSGDYTFQEAFWDELLSGTTVRDAISYMKAIKGSWDTCNGHFDWPTIEQARNNYAAFPIVVSDEDAYPGQGNVDNLQAVLSSWRLLTPYLVTARSSNNAHGLVTLTGSVITAYSANGYYAAGCSVEPAGAATVVQNSNRFTLTDITQDCTVTVTFAPKTAASIYFAVPDGVTQARLDAQTGDTLTLPTPEGTPDGEKTYTFLGWTDEAVPGTDVMPDCYPAGSTLWLGGDTTLYALYKYLDDSAGSMTDFVLKNVSQIEPTDPVIITMRSGVTLYALHGGNGAKAAPAAMVVNAVSNTILNPVQAVRWNIVNENGNLHIYPDGKTDAWLYCDANDNGVRVGTSTNNTFTVSGSYLQNTETARYLGVYSSTPDWRCFSTTGGSIAGQTLGFYAAKAGKLRYSTLVAHVWGTGVVTVKPTCSHEGVCTYTCMLCSQTRTEPIPVIGHHDDDGDGLCDDCPQLRLSAQKGIAGGPVTISISMRNNPGIVCAQLALSYDPDKLTLIAAEDTGLLGGASFGSDLSAMPFTLSWDDSEQAVNNTQDGAIVNLTFEIAEGCALGNLPITVNYSADDIFDKDGNPISFVVAPGAVIVNEYLPGDVDGDGQVLAKDVAVLRRFLAHWAGVSIHEAAADVNADGNITAPDVALLRRYLAHWAGVSLKNAAPIG